MDRRNFIKSTAIVGGALAALGPFQALSARRAMGAACFYRYVPRPRGTQPLAQTRGPLQALKLRDEFHANMDTGRVVGVPYRVEWVTIDEPDHDDDTDNRMDRVAGLTPNRIQAQDNNETEFCGGCFDPDGGTFYVNQQGDRGNLPGGPVNGGAVTYAIYGPFNKRAGNNSKNLV